MTRIGERLAISQLAVRASRRCPVRAAPRLGLLTRDVLLRDFHQIASLRADYHQQHLVKNPDGYCGIGGVNLRRNYFGTGKPFMQTIVRSASSGRSCVKPRFAVHRTSPRKIKLVLLSSGAFCLEAIKIR
jgi:hypothetical protein